MDDLIQEKVAQKENELNATYDEKMRNYEERYVAVLSWGNDIHRLSQGARPATAIVSDQEPAPRPSHVARVKSSQALGPYPTSR